MTDVTRPANHRRSGVAALELAVALPVLLVVIVGCLDIGRVVHDRIVLSSCARAGATQAATHRFTSSTQAVWEQRVRDAVAGEAASLAGCDPVGVSVTIETAPAAGDRLDVTVRVEGMAETIVHWPGLPDVFPVSHAVTMRQYR